MIERTADTLPAFVLGGTGYVAGELLRLIAGHPRLRAGGHHVRQPAGRARSRAAFPPSGERVSRALDFSGADEIERLSRASRGQRAVLGRAARRRRRAHRPAARRGRGRADVHTHVVDISADFRYASGRGLRRRSTSTRMARPRAFAEFTCAVPEHLSDLHRRRTWPSRAASPPRRCSPRAAAGARAHRTASCSSPGSPAAPARDASPSTARTIRCGTATSTATSALAHRHCAEITACARAGIGGRRPRSPSCRIRDRSRAASMSPCRRGCARRARRAGRARRRCASSTAAAASCASPSTAPRVKDVAASNYAQLSAVSRRPHRRGDVRARQS